MVLKKSDLHLHLIQIDTLSLDNMKLLWNLERVSECFINKCKEFWRPVSSLRLLLHKALRQSSFLSFFNCLSLILPGLRSFFSWLSIYLILIITRDLTPFWLLLSWCLSVSWIILLVSSTSSMTSFVSFSSRSSLDPSGTEQSNTFHLILLTFLPSWLFPSTKLWKPLHFPCFFLVFFSDSATISFLGWN